MKRACLEPIMYRRSENRAFTSPLDDMYPGSQGIHSISRNGFFSSPITAQRPSHVFFDGVIHHPVIHRQNPEMYSTRKKSLKTRKRSMQNSVEQQVTFEPGLKRKKEECPVSSVARRQSPNDIKFKKLADEIKEFAENYLQTGELLEKKLRLRSALLSIFQESFPEANLFLVGSSCNGFGSNSSDADFCLMLTENRKVDQRHEAVMYLRTLQRKLRSCNFIRGLQVIKAKVPILKFCDTISGCECDVNINNSLGIRNTHLLRTYSQVDSRVKPILMIVKKWAKTKGINDASQGTLSSYSLALMVIHYLQCACKPSVIPTLQQEYPEYFSENLDLTRLPFFEPAEHIPCDRSANRKSAGELLHGFFKYFGVDFRWDILAVSVRLGRALPKALKNDWKTTFICIEEPYDQTNTARAVHQPAKFEIIKREFRQAYESLEKESTLESLLR